MPPKLHSPDYFKDPQAALGFFLAGNRANTEIVPLKSEVDPLLKEHMEMVTENGPALQQFMQSRYRIFATQTMLDRAKHVHAVHPSPLLQ